MKIVLFLLALILAPNLFFAQVDKNIYELNSIDNLLTEEVKKIIDRNLIDKRVVFLGEAEHHIGSDFLAKTEFVKYLVLEHGYKDIAFESDFFGLYFDHNKRNTFPHWSRSVQCQELFDFLDTNKVTIWGFDNQTHSYYTKENFILKLTEFLNENSIIYDAELFRIAEVIVKNNQFSNKVINSTEVDFLINQLNLLLENSIVENNRLWFQFLESFKSAVIIYTNGSKKEGKPIRDTQMAKNLDFLIKTNGEKKFIVWVANAHMSKLDYEFMDGETMGNQFIKLSNNISYHIAISSIKMPYRKEKWLLKSAKDENNLLHFLPSIDNNYFIDSKNLITSNPECESKEYDGMFNLKGNKTNWFKHFDALVFIANGEKVKYPD